MLTADLNRHTVVHRVVSLTTRGVHAEVLEKHGIKVDVLGMSRGRVTPLGLWHLYRVLKTSQADVVQTWMYHSDLLGGVAARLAGIRRVIWGIRHSNLDPSRNSRSTLAVVRLCSWLSRVVPLKVVSCSHNASKLHIRHGYAPQKFIDIPNGYRTDLFRRDDELRQRTRAGLGIDGDHFVVGMVARFDPLKDHRNLIGALRTAKRGGSSPFLCLLVGPGMDATNSDLINWLGEAELLDIVRLLGVRSDVPAIMNAIDLKVLSSAGEAFPNVLAEAMACGTPCVTTDVGDAAVIVDRFGWVVPAQDSTALADAISTAKDLHARRRDLWNLRCDQGIAHIAQHFSMERMWNNYYSVWAECCAS
ncbi:MAG: glycosyltransferase [Proteobacteria bacterium]|nr:glycosyltransferase [Pseudomonadota bacterium]